jgi:hypothetical protein
MRIAPLGLGSLSLAWSNRQNAPDVRMLGKAFWASVFMIERRETLGKPCACRPWPGTSGPTPDFGRCRLSHVLRGSAPDRYSDRASMQRGRHQASVESERSNRPADPKEPSPLPG